MSYDPIKPVANRGEARLSRPPQPIGLGARLLALPGRLAARWRESAEVAGLTHRELRDMGIDRYDLAKEPHPIRWRPW